MSKYSKLNILLIEDDDVDIMAVQRGLKKGRMFSSLYVANNGVEALSMLRDEAGKSSIIPKERLIIISDLNMPQMDGLTFLKELRADKSLKHIPVLVLATFIEKEDLLTAYQYNVAGYMIKPTSYNNFVRLLLNIYNYWTLCELN